MVQFNRASKKKKSGIWRDLAVRKRKTEVDAQIAPVSEYGEKNGVDTPLVDRLVELIHSLEEEAFMSLRHLIELRDISERVYGRGGLSNNMQRE
jgi:2-dehydropantoate 2-reductase